MTTHFNLNDESQNKPRPAKSESSPNDKKNKTARREDRDTCKSFFRYSSANHVKAGSSLVNFTSGREKGRTEYPNRTQRQPPSLRGLRKRHRLVDGTSCPIGWQIRGPLAWNGRLLISECFPRYSRLDETYAILSRALQYSRINELSDPAPGSC